MGLDMNLLYGEMIGSAIIHSVLPLIIYVIFYVNYYYDDKYIISLILLCIVGSFLVNFGFISSIQQNSCGGLKSMESVAIGAAIAALVTGVMVAIPVYVEPMRLMVTSFIGIKSNNYLDMAVGSSFWLLFAGAYGIAIGGIMSTSCVTLDQASGGELP